MGHDSSARFASYLVWLVKGFELMIISEGGIFCC
jgi:hypothetical protein